MSVSFDSTPGYRLSRGQLKNFVSALTMALYDTVLERTREIVYYYDSDVLVDIVLGVDARPKEPEPDLQTRIVWGLLSAGYLGHAHVLRPHAIELESALHLQSKEDAKYPPNVKRIKDFLQSAGVLDNIKALALRSRASTGSEHLRRFLEFLQEVGPETFVALEKAANGTWKHRLIRLYSEVLIFDESDYIMREVLEEPLTWKFYNAMNEVRPKSNKRSNNLRDAVALCQLSKKVQSGQADGKSPLVRFNTSSQAFLAVAEGELSAFLTYDIAVDMRGARRWRVGSILREPAYYVIRASFEALRFRHLDTNLKEVAEPALTIDDLETLCDRLNDALAADDSRMETLIGQIKVGDKNLSVVIKELERLSFLRTVLSRYEPPGSLKKLIKGLAEVWEFIETDDPQMALRQEIQDEANAIGQALSLRVGGLRDWLKGFRQIERAAQRVALNSREATVPDPFRDLGVVRWGEELCKADEETVREFCQALVTGAPASIIENCAALAWKVTSANSASKSLGICCLLWMLSLFDRVVEVINSAQDLMKQDFPVSLNILRTAARLRANAEFSAEEKWNHILALEGLVHNEPKEKRGRLLIGLGYTAFYVWTMEQRMANTDAIAWANRSFKYAEEAESLLEEDPLGYAFAINHCAYVGECAEIFPEHTNRCISILGKLRGNSQIWNYRFADTLAYREFKHAVLYSKELAGTRDSEQRHRLKRSACSACVQAARLVSEAQPPFGDFENPDRRRGIRNLLERLGCLEEEKMSSDRE